MQRHPPTARTMTSSGINDFGHPSPPSQKALHRHRDLRPVLDLKYEGRLFGFCQLRLTFNQAFKIFFRVHEPMGLSNGDDRGEQMFNIGSDWTKKVLENIITCRRHCTRPIIGPYRWGEPRTPKASNPLLFLTPSPNFLLLLHIIIGSDSVWKTPLDLELYFV